MRVCGKLMGKHMIEGGKQQLQEIRVKGKFGSTRIKQDQNIFKQILKEIS